MRSFNIFIDLLLQTRLTKEVNCMQCIRVAINVPALVFIYDEIALHTHRVKPGMYVE